MDRALSPKLTLPDLALDADWPARRREWLELAERCLYGSAPEAGEVRGEVLRRRSQWQGAGFRETVRVHYGPDLGLHFDATLFLPARPGRHPAITWNQFAIDPGDGCPYREAVAERGYIIARFNREQAARDRKGGGAALRRVWPGYGWGAVRMWAWAQSRLADYLLTRADVDPQRLVCTGFSRGGKAALAAGIFDERFAVCAPICAGAGGTGCFRYLGDKDGFCQDARRVETLGCVGSQFPYWWSEAFARWWPRPDPRQMGLEDAFPLDIHVLKALIAPRNLFTSNGIDDAWANPRGTALTWRAAQSAFDRLGGRSVARFRPGGHGFLAEDWRALLDFCDEVFFEKVTGRDWAREAPPPEWTAPLKGNP